MGGRSVTHGGLVALIALVLIVSSLVSVPQKATAAGGPQMQACSTKSDYFSVTHILYTGICALPAKYKKVGHLDTQYRQANLPTGRTVRGRDHDGCSASPDKPFGKYDFKVACWMHDLGYEWIRYGVLPRESEPIVDRVFLDTLRHICISSYGNSKLCRSTAEAYGRAVAAKRDFPSDRATSFGAILPVGQVGMLRSQNYPDGYLAPRASGSTLSPMSTTYTQGGKFRVVKGLAGSGISFQSVKYPNQYLRHQNYTLKLQTRQKTALFNADATFIAERPRGQRPDLVRLKSKNYPDRYVRHYEGKFEVSSKTFRPGTPYDKDRSFSFVRLR